MPLIVPSGIRATENKVRQAIFNILGSAIEGARVLDGFAGSGALGLEALSRGAREVVFVESAPACLRAIDQNLERASSLGVEGRWNVLKGNALQCIPRLARDGPFEVIVLDPPYQGSWGEKALNAVAACAILAPAGILCLEHARAAALPSTVASLALWKQHRYGDTVLSFYHLQAIDHAHSSRLSGHL